MWVNRQRDERRRVKAENLKPIREAEPGRGMMHDRHVARARFEAQLRARGTQPRESIRGAFGARAWSRVALSR